MAESHSETVEIDEQLSSEGCSLKDENILKRLEAFNSAIENYMNSCFGNQCFVNALVRSFKPVYRKNKEEFLKKANEVEANLNVTVRQSFSAEIENFSISEKLQELEELQKETDREKIAWRPSGDPENDVRAYLCVVKAKHLSQHEDQVNCEYELLQKELEEKLKRYNDKKEALRSKSVELSTLVENYKSQIESLSEHLPCEPVDDD